MVSQGDLGSFWALERSAKKVANKALTTKKWRQGESQGEYGGDDLKDVEVERLTKLVVCDTWSLGGSVVNCVFEKEGGEVGGFVENYLKVEEDGVRYVSDHMDDEFIIFSK